jgi:hypothetical protein
MRKPAPLIVVLLILLLAPIARAGEVWHFKREFMPALVKAIPGILESQDKKTGRFGTGVFIVNDQHPMYSLAVAWGTKIDGVDNPYYHDTAVLDAIMSAGDALIAVQDPKGNAGRLRALDVGLVKPAPHDSQAQLILEDAVHRGISHIVDAFERLVRVVHHARCVPQQEDQKNE